MARSLALPVPGRILARAAMVVLAAMLIGPWQAANAMEANEESDPSVVVRAFGDAAVEVIARQDMTPAEREGAFRALFISYFDVAGIGRFVLGPYWRKASLEEREDYVTVFEDFIVMTYAQRMTEYSGETFDVGAARERGDKEVLVSSRILRDPDPAIDLDWRLKRHGGGWLIVDLKVSGISMAQTRRAEFSTVLKQQGGLPSLLDKLREMTDRARNQA